MSEEKIIKEIEKIIFDLDMVDYHKDLYSSDEVETANYQVKYIKKLLDLYYKQQRIMKSQEKIIMEQEEEIDKYKKQEFGNLFNGRYISKDKVLKALGYEENDEEYKRIYNKEEMILSLIRTINEECDRLEDIEDKKVMLETHNIENMRDKYWQKKIRDEIKKLEQMSLEDDTFGKMRDYAILILKELLED